MANYDLYSSGDSNVQKAIVTPINEKKSVRDNPFYGAVVSDIIVPTVKDMMYNIGHSLLNYACYGSFGSRGGRRAGVNSDYVSYNAYYRDDRARKVEHVNVPQQRADKYRGRADATIYSFPDLFAVEHALDEMAERLAYSHKLTVADMYDIADVSGAPITAENYGWTDISKAQKSRDPQEPSGWIIKMPTPKDVRNI